MKSRQREYDGDQVFGKPHGRRRRGYFLRVFFLAEADRAATIPRFFMTWATVSPMTAGLSATVIPARRSAAILASAVPEAPEMIAPACPMRLPVGAVRPAMNDTTGFFICFLTQAAPSSSPA